MTAPRIGYARVSRIEQNPQLQTDALRAAGCVRVFSESASGASRDRPELARALDHVRPGDVLVVWKLDRLGRSLADLLTILRELKARGVGFLSLTEGIDTTTVMGELVFGILGAVAQFERAQLLERSAAGQAVARAAGRIGGARKKLSREQRREALAMLADGRPPGEVAHLFKVHKSTISRMAGAERAKELKP